jgi:uncharacterized protein
MDKALIVMSSGPDTPRRCATPFYMASMGAAMDYDVAIFFTIEGTLLLKQGVAETIYPKPGGKPVSEFIREAMDAGVQFLACTASCDLHELQPADLIPGVKMVGAARMWELAEESKIVLSY